MSEKLNLNIENGDHSPEQSQPHHEAKHEHEVKHESHNKLSDKERQEQLASLRNEVSKESKSLNEAKIDHTTTEKDRPAQGPINKELKNMMRVRTLTRIRKELSSPDRVLSKVIHSKPVEKVSAVGEKTVARPVGLLGGSLIALTGSLITLYMAKHYGFRYNLLLFLMLFGIGYLLATILEVVFKLGKKARN
jgi:hypothetical protein